MAQGNKREHLLKEERFCIEKMKKAGFSSEQIAKTIGRGKSTVDEELARGGGIEAYDYKVAHQRAYLKQYHKKKECLKVAMNTGMSHLTEYYLCIKDWSPDTISATLWLRHNLKVSAKAIYRYIYSRRLEWTLPNHNLRKKSGYGRSLLLDRIFITDPKCIRTGYGHWEGDFIVSPNNTSVLLVLVERLTKEVKLAYLPNRTNDLVNQTITQLLKDRTVSSLTLDNDIAFTKHTQLSQLLKVPIFFTRPYRSTDKALVENTNRWLRKFIPKGTDLKLVPEIVYKKALDWLNERPRECLGWMTAGLCARQQEEMLLMR
jgi:IS30 family transposase